MSFHRFSKLSKWHYYIQFYQCCRFKGSNTVTPSNIGAVTYTVPYAQQIEVHQGDLIGILVTSGVIPFTEQACSPYNTGGFGQTEVHHAVLPDIGEIVSIDIHAMSCRTYPIRAHIESIP